MRRQSESWARMRSMPRSRMYSMAAPKRHRRHSSSSRTPDVAPNWRGAYGRRQGHTARPCSASRRTAGRAARGGLAQVADGRTERCSQPLVATRDQHVDTARLHVDRDHPCRLCRVDHQRGVVGMGEMCQLIERETMSGGELHMTDADHRGLVIDQRRDRIERQCRWVVLRLDETNFRPSPPPRGTRGR